MKRRARGPGIKYLTASVQKRAKTNNKSVLRCKIAHHVPPAFSLAEAAIVKQSAPGKACAVQVDTVEPSKPNATVICGSSAAMKEHTANMMQVSSSLPMNAAARGTSAPTWTLLLQTEKRAPPPLTPRRLPTYCRNYRSDEESFGHHYLCPTRTCAGCDNIAEAEGREVGV
jgi:hypothetical protein